MVNIFTNFLCLFFSMLQVQIIIHPGHKVVFEDTFDELMKQIWCKEHVDISMREAVSKWLKMTSADIFIFREY